MYLGPVDEGHFAVLSDGKYGLWARHSTAAAEEGAEPLVPGYQVRVEGAEMRRVTAKTWKKRKHMSTRKKVWECKAYNLEFFIFFIVLNKKAFNLEFFIFFIVLDKKAFNLEFFIFFIVLTNFS